MQRFIKFLAFVFILSVYPMVRFVAQNFILDSDKEIYSYIPQESDVIIELNTRNFIDEVAYQRVFNEVYFNEQFFPEDEVQPTTIPNLGINFFNSVILFREQWADENIWLCIAEYNNKSDFNKFMSEEMEDVNLVFGEKYVIAQLNHSVNQEEVDKHLEKVIKREVKSINPKVDLANNFDKNKEINCYFEPGTLNADNQLINGFLSFDFLKDKISTSGEFTPVSGFEHNPGIAYALNEDAAFSMRSSLNIFNSIYWFGKERIDNVPEYSQMALDYDGMKVFVVDPEFNNDFPFKFFPEFQVHFDLYDPVLWHEFFDSLESKGKIRVDTTTHQIITENGAYFQYNLTDLEFELMRSTVNLQEIDNEETFFVMHMNIDELIDNTKKAVDEKNPPNQIMRTVLNAGIEEMLDELRLISCIKQINFEMSAKEESIIMAEGEASMKNLEGNSIIECLSFGKEALIFVKNYLEQSEEE